MTHNITNALSSIWNNKIRSILTVLGVIIGVTSVTTLVSLGEGLKKDVSSLIEDFGTNMIAVTSGKIDISNGSTSSTNPANFISGDILTLKDVESMAAIPEIRAVSPGGIVSGNLKYGEKTSAPTILGTYPNILEAFELLTIDKGTMFTSRSAGNVIVLGKTAREALFGETDPVGKKVTLGQQELVVIGTLKTKQATGMFGSEFDGMSLIPFDTATSLNKNQEKVFRIYASANQTADVATVKQKVHEVILTNHGGEEDFTVMSQDDMLNLFNTFLNLSTTMVSAIAAISLIVGGIGIMNIMLVTVTERTREIGLRKAVGATKTAILVQFLTEAIIITLLGSLIGLGISICVGQIIASQTALKPVITAEVVGIAVGIAVVIGVIFGLWPALRAANKDPIEALRYE